MRFINTIPYSILAVLVAGSALAHEFWISPESFVYAPEEEMQVNLRVGQEFNGSAYSFNPRNFNRFELVIGDDTVAVEGRLGDLPALSMKSPGTGLVIVTHETTESQLTYTDWAKFTKFVTHKDFPDTLSDHLARGLTKDEKFTESYIRFAKSLIAIGQGQGQDRAVGLRTEIVALENPYHLDAPTLPVQVLLNDAPKAETQVELFEKSPKGEVEITLHRTNSDGVAELPVKPGYSYLVDAVSMVPLKNNDQSSGPVWQSLWASLTFQVPATPLK